MFKKMMMKAIKDTYVSGRELKDMVLVECLPAPAIGPQQVGDIVLYCRESRASKQELSLNARSRLTGFEKNKKTVSVKCNCETPNSAVFFLISHIRVVR